MAYVIQEQCKEKGFLKFIQADTEQNEQTHVHTPKLEEQNVHTSELEEHQNLKSNVHENEEEQMEPKPSEHEGQKKQKAYRCYFCGDKFTERSIFRKHIHHHLERTYECEECGSTFFCQKTWRKHTLAHNKSMAYQCETCGKTYSANFNLQLHIKKVHENQDYVPRLCIFCLKELWHTNKYNICKPCKDSGKMLDELGKITCRQCGSNFKTIGEINFHVDNEINCKGVIEDPSILPELCGLCGKRFKNTSGLKGHLHYHDSDRNFHCPHCDRKLKSSAALRSHIQIHNTNRPYECGKCDKKYKTTRNLGKHLRKEHVELINNSNNNYSFVCDICNKSFPLHSMLRKHRRVLHHVLTEERGVLCTKCTKVYTSRNYLKKHKCIGKKTEAG